MNEPKAYEKLKDMREKALAAGGEAASRNNMRRAN